jgi:sigma-E factor negative regulatory protein RseA
MNHTDDSIPLEDLSALVDGEADASMAAAASAAWRDDARVRERWHRYQLIGDVLRSEELAGTGQDAEFLEGVRARLAHEPVVLAPAVLEPVRAEQGVELAAGRGARAVPRSRAMRRWAPPAALAAGFMMVAVGGIVFLRAPSSPVEGPLAKAPAPVVVVQVGQSPRVQPDTANLALSLATVPVAAEVADANALPEQATGGLIRSARLDEYLAAHKQFGGSSALGMPSQFLRNATYEGGSAVLDSR